MALALLAAAAACGSPSQQPSAAGSSVRRTPEFSVSSTFSLPTLPGATAGASPGTRSGASGTGSPTAAPSEQPLAGRTILLDPGHNGGNAAHPEIINRLVDAGGGLRKPCDTTGTATRSGYPEHEFTLDVAKRTAAVLRTRGAKVVLTRTTSAGVGPCVDQRAQAGNRIAADAALSLHADGGPPSGVGFHVIRPGQLPGQDADAYIASSQLATAVHDAVLRTGEPAAGYVGRGGYDERTDLGGLNLSTVPKVFLESGNMRAAADAARLTDAGFRQRLAVALADGLSSFLFGR